MRDHLARAWRLLALWAPPVVLGGLVIVEAWGEPFLDERTFSGPPLAYTASALVMAAGLVVRARAPAACLAAVLVELLVEWAYSPEGTQGVSAEWFAAMLIAFYSVGAFRDLRGAVILLAAAQPVLLAVMAVNVARGDSTVVSSAALYPFMLGLWGAGVGVRRMRLRATTLQDRVGTLAREGDARAQAAVAEERARIARELHDIVAHSVSTMVLQASGARQVLHTHVDDADDALRTVEVTGRQALRELRRMLGILRTDDGPVLDPQPGIADLPTLVRQMADAGLPARLETTGLPAPLAPGLDLAAYRIIQEALTNVLKHAGPVDTTVRVGFEPDTLDLIVENAAAARTPSGDGAGHGLIGMRERVALYDGTLAARPDGRGGFAVHARIPFGKERA